MPACSGSTWSALSLAKISFPHGIGKEIDAAFNLEGLMRGFLKDFGTSKEPRVIVGDAVNNHSMPGVIFHTRGLSAVSQ